MMMMINVIMVDTCNMFGEIVHKYTRKDMYIRFINNAVAFIVDVSFYLIVDSLYSNRFIYLLLYIKCKSQHAYNYLPTSWANSYLSGPWITYMERRGIINSNDSSLILLTLLLLLVLLPPPLLLPPPPTTILPPAAAD